MQWSNWNKYKFFFLWPGDEEGAFTSSIMGEPVLKFAMMKPRTVTLGTLAPALISYHIFEISINRDFANRWS